MEQADGVRAAADAGDHGIRQAAGALQDLRARLAADDGLQLAHQVRIGMRADRRAEQVVGAVRIGHPVAQRLVDGGAQRPVAAGHRHHRGAEQAHAADVRRLALHVDRAHVHRARQADARAGRGASRRRAGRRRSRRRCACAPRRLREQRLAERVVDLVRAGVREVLALEPDLRAPALRRAAARGVSAVGRPDPVAQLRGRARRWKSGVAQVAPHALPRAARAPAPASRARSGRRTGRSGRARPGSRPASRSRQQSLAFGPRSMRSCFDLLQRRARGRDECLDLRRILDAAAAISTPLRHVDAEGPHARGSPSPTLSGVEPAGEDQPRRAARGRAPAPSRRLRRCRCAALRTAARAGRPQPAGARPARSTGSARQRLRQRAARRSPRRRSAASRARTLAAISSTMRLRADGASPRRSMTRAARRPRKLARRAPASPAAATARTRSRSRRRPRPAPRLHGLGARHAADLDEHRSCAVGARAARPAREHRRAAAAAGSAARISALPTSARS